MSEIHNILKTTHSKVHTIPSSQVQYIKYSKFTSAIHKNESVGDVSTCDPGDALAGDGPTCDAGDPPTWFSFILRVGVGMSSLLEIPRVHEVPLFLDNG
jgi:hypothetical protein